jgi:hypothetical protein
MGSRELKMTHKNQGSSFWSETDARPPPPPKKNNVIFAHHSPLAIVIK